MRRHPSHRPPPLNAAQGGQPPNYNLSQLNLSNGDLLHVPAGATYDSINGAVVIKMFTSIPDPATDLIKTGTQNLCEIQ